MSLTVSIRIKRLTASKVAGQNRHDLRQTIPGYVNKDRTPENDIIIEPANPTALRQTCADRRAQRHCQRVLKSDAAIAMGGIITFGTEAQAVIQSLSKAEQSAMYLSIGQQLAKRLNTTLTGLVVHNDEAAPHAHFQLPGYDLDGVPLSKTVTREVTSHLQDIAGQVMAEHKLEITRGKPKAQRIEDGEDRSKIIHRSVAELHRDLPKELESARQKLEKNRALIAKAKEDLATETKGREEKIQKRLEAYERRAAVAKADAERLEAMLPKDTQPAPVVTITTADIKDWQPKKAGWFREETETAAAERASVSPTIRAANRLLSDQQRALGFAGNKTARERSDREAAERQRDELARKYEKGLSDQQQQHLQQQADKLRQDNELRRDERMKQRSKDKDKGLKR